MLKPYTYIVIPAKDESTRIGQVLNSLSNLGYQNVIVVDDGSQDNTAEIAKSFQAQVVVHPINMGPGAATQTGISLALKLGAEYIVTIDADTQHYPEDIDSLLKAIIDQNVEVVIGSRFLTSNNIPVTRIFYNKIANVVTYMATGIYLSDSQSGLKAFTAEFARKSKLYHNGFEFCVEIIRNIKDHKVRFTEVPISVKYTADTLSKGQNLFIGFRMLGRIFKIF